MINVFAIFATYSLSFCDFWSVKNTKIFHFANKRQCCHIFLNIDNISNNFPDFYAKSFSEFIILAPGLKLVVESTRKSIVSNKKSSLANFCPTNFLLASFTHRNPRTHARRSIFEKREKIFQLIYTLFCEVKIGFVDPWKKCSFEVKYLV
jgi:hypothetical protein